MRLIINQGQFTLFIHDTQSFLGYILSTKLNLRIHSILLRIKCTLGHRSH